MIGPIEPPKGKLETKPGWVLLTVVMLGASVCSIPFAWFGILYLIGMQQSVGSP